MHAYSIEKCFNLFLLQNPASAVFPNSPIFFGLSRCSNSFSLVSTGSISPIYVLIERFTLVQLDSAEKGFSLILASESSESKIPQAANSFDFRRNLNSCFSVITGLISSIMAAGKPFTILPDTLLKNHFHPLIRAVIVAKF